MQKCKTVLLAILLSVSVQVAHAEDQDGNWWQGNSKSYKTAYILGFWDGRIEEAENWDAALILSGPKEFNPEYIKFVAGIEDIAYQRRNSGGNVTLGQLSDGIDTFYGDYKNRLIPVRHAIRIIQHNITGQSAEFIERLTVELRKQSSGTSDLLKPNVKKGGIKEP